MINPIDDTFISVAASEADINNKQKRVSLQVYTNELGTMQFILQSDLTRNFPGSSCILYRPNDDDDERSLSILDGYIRLNKETYQYAVKKQPKLYASKPVTGKIVTLEVRSIFCKILLVKIRYP
jgi:hypothetical protein